MMTKVWGPAGWLFLHSVVYGYPTKIDPKNKNHIERKKDMKNFFKSIGGVFPCVYCRNSFKKFTKQIPIDNYLNSRKDLTLWLYKIHNKVNEKLNITDCKIPCIDTVDKKYEKFRAGCDSNKKGCVIPVNKGKVPKCKITIK